MLGAAREVFHVVPRYQPVFQALGLTAQSVFTDPRIVVWRSIRERQNCTLDIDLGDGKTTRLHVKRYFPARGFLTPADEESRGIRALEIEQIPTAPLVAYGKLTDGRSFLITEDLAGFRPADKLIAEGFDFEKLLEPTADLAARLHDRGLHHRDLYLCHFFAKPGSNPLELRLIDAARVRRLPGFLTRRRWIVKDLAQFWYSTQSLAVTDDQRTRWLARYAARRGLRSADGLGASVRRKAGWIARHDRRLQMAQPRRNISIPSGGFLWL
ncbi:MAG TPA: lipopolysaccharide kinase InaA family protein [Tepidisphaeraceae bacterium]